MRILLATAALLLSVIEPTTVCAQVNAQPDSAQLAAMSASALQLSKSAAFVLQHRTELALSAAQVTALEALALAQADSMVARQARMVSQMQTNPPSPALLAVVSWAGEIDERAVREALCQSSISQAELMLGMARDRRATAAVLTPSQAARLPGLQMNDLLNAAKR